MTVVLSYIVFLRSLLQSEVVEYNILEWIKSMSPKVTCVARVTLAFFCIDFISLIYILVFYPWVFLLKSKYFV